MKTIVVIPAYNEEKHIGAVVSRVRKYVPDVIVVDDGSKDQTITCAQKSGAIVLHHLINLGKAGGIKTGCEAAILLGAEIIILIDADGQHNPDEIPHFLEALNDETQFVFGTRHDTRSMPFVRRLGTIVLKYGMQRLFDMRISDMQCGYRAFRTSVYPKICWKSNNYYADAEMTARVGKFHLRYKAIPIETIYNEPDKGMTIFDGMGLPLKLLIWKMTL